MRRRSGTEWGMKWRGGADWGWHVGRYVVGRVDRWSPCRVVLLAVVLHVEGDFIGKAVGISRQSNIPHFTIAFLNGQHYFCPCRAREVRQRAIQAGCMILERLPVDLHKRITLANSARPVRRPVPHHPHDLEVACFRLLKHQAHAALAIWWNVTRLRWHLDVYRERVGDNVGLAVRKLAVGLVVPLLEVVQVRVLGVLNAAAHVRDGLPVGHLRGARVRQAARARDGRQRAGRGKGAGIGRGPGRSDCSPSLSQGRRTAGRDSLGSVSSEFPGRDLRKTQRSTQNGRNYGGARGLHSERRCDGVFAEEQCQADV